MSMVGKVSDDLSAWIGACLLGQWVPMVHYLPLTAPAVDSHSFLLVLQLLQFCDSHSHTDPDLEETCRECEGKLQC